MVPERDPDTTAPLPPVPAAAAPPPLQDEGAIRPYVITGGRTRPEVRLGWDTMVWTTERGADGVEGTAVGAEGKRAARFCTRPRSVAEVAACLDLPLGVSRIVLSDLARQQIVTVHRPTGTVDSDMVHRMLRKLRTL